MTITYWNRYKGLIAIAGLLIASQYSLDAKEYQVAFYTGFEPVSYSASPEPSDPGFNDARGYEIDLLKAIEAIPDSNMSFKFHGVNQWRDIWLTPYRSPEIDLVVGGIDEEERRKKNSIGKKVVDVTHKTLTFKQSLLMNKSDAAKVKTFNDLNCDYTIGVIRESTEENRFLLQSKLIGNLQLGKIRKGAKVVLENKDEITSDGELRIYEPKLKTRTMIIPPDCPAPKVKYYTDEPLMYSDLNEGKINGIASDHIGNQFEASKSNGKLFVTAISTLDCPHEKSIDCDKPEYATMYLKADDKELQDKLNKYIDYLTNNGAIEFEDWKANPNIFMQRAKNYRNAARVP